MRLKLFSRSSSTTITQLLLVVTLLQPSLMVLPRTTAAPYRETELVIINSSLVGAGVGPNPRVIKRKDSCYMRPRPPISPSRNTMAPISVSSNSKARFQNNYVKINGKNFFLETSRIRAVTIFWQSLLHSIQASRQSTAIWKSWSLCKPNFAYVYVISQYKTVDSLLILVENIM